MNTNKTKEEPHSLTGHELGGVDSTASGQSTPVTSEEVAIQIKAVTNPLTKQLERPCGLMKELRQTPPKRNEITSDVIQGSSKDHSFRFYNEFSIFRIDYFRNQN